MYGMDDKYDHLMFEVGFISFTRYAKNVPETLRMDEKYYLTDFMVEQELMSFTRYAKNVPEPFRMELIYDKLMFEEELTSMISALFGDDIPTEYAENLSKEKLIGGRETVFIKMVRAYLELDSLRNSCNSSSRSYPDFVERRTNYRKVTTADLGVSDEKKRKIRPKQMALPQRRNQKAYVPLKMLKNNRKQNRKH